MQRRPRDLPTKDWFLYGSFGNLSVDLSPHISSFSEWKGHFVAFRVGEASGQSDLGDSDPNMVTKVYYVSLNDGPTIRR
jgi:hypothetical protein